MFDGEFAGLQAILETNTIRVPKPLAVVSFGPENNKSAALVMESLKFSSTNSSQQALLGEKLALLAPNAKNVVYISFRYLEIFSAVV